MADTPIPDEPGLVVHAPPGKQRWSTACPSAAAAYRCLCGATGSASGPAKVLVLLEEWGLHIECSPYRMVMEEVRRLHGDPPSSSSWPR